MISKLKLITSMLIFGTIGIFVNYIDLPSGFIAFVRGGIGAVCLILFALVSRSPISGKEIKNNFWLLVISGAAIGFNWIFLFESYRFAGVPIGTLCYYMAPVFVMVASPFILKERFTVKKLFSIILALGGMVFVSGIIGGELPKGEIAVGIAFGLAAALLYASVILMNKKLKDISANNKTVVQLASAAIVVLPYSLIFESIDAKAFTPLSETLLICVGVVHTGIAYLLYFGSLSGVTATTAAIFSYIDPALAIVLSAIILSQPMDNFAKIGAVLILLGALLSEIDFGVKMRNENEDI